jgi:hypothetical protein
MRGTVAYCASASDAGGDRLRADRGMFVLGCGVVSGFAADKLNLVFGPLPPDALLTDGAYGFHFFSGEAALTHSLPVKFREYARLLQEKKRAAVTAPNMNPDRAHGELKRAGYLGVFNIENVVIDDAGISFDFAGAYARRRNV